MMIPHRTSHAAIGVALVICLALLALASVNEPRGGLAFAGMALFSEPYLTGPLSAAMAAIGLSAGASHGWLGAVAACDMAASGLIIFALLFRFLGEAVEQSEAAGYLFMSFVLQIAAAVLVFLPAVTGGALATFFYLQIVLAASTFLLAQGFAAQAAGQEKTEKTVMPDLSRLARAAANSSRPSAPIFDLSGRRRDP